MVNEHTIVTTLRRFDCCADVKLRSVNCCGDRRVNCCAVAVT